MVREALRREQNGLLQRQPPAQGESLTLTLLPSPPLSGQQQRSSEQLSHIQQTPTAASSQQTDALLCSWLPLLISGTAGEPTGAARFAASPPHPPGSKSPASPPLEMGNCSARAVDAKVWQGASGGGEGEMTAKALAVVTLGMLEKSIRLHHFNRLL